jgi:hypothetical protein
MKRKNSGTTDLRVFLARAAAKKQSEQTSVAPSCNERHMQLVIFQERRMVEQAQHRLNK